jgi:hypothetical protein
MDCGKMAKMSSGETFIKVVTFSGKKKDWQMWEEKFLASQG